MRSSDKYVRLQFTAICATLLSFTVMSAESVAQRRGGPWTEMSKTEAEKLLNDSPWAQIQVDTDVSEMFFSPTRPGTATVGRSTARGAISDQQSINNNRADRGALNQPIEITYRIRFLSARPIREAFAKLLIASERQPDADLMQRLDSFVRRDFSAYIVIAVVIDSNDNRFLGPVMQQVNSASKGSLKNKAYLERPDGKRVFLLDYHAPIADGLGAKFIFPRRPEGEEFVTSEINSVRFVAEFSDNFKLNMRFKVSDMIYDNKLEY